MESFKTLLLGTPPTRTYTASATGLLTSANNLSDVADPSTAFTNIKQAATTSATGVVELATQAEVVAGTDTSRAVVPVDLAYSTALRQPAPRPGLISAGTSAAGTTQDNTGLAFGTGDLTIGAWVRLADWTPAAEAHLFSKQGSNLGVKVTVTTGGFLRAAFGTGASVVNFDSTVVTGLTDGAWAFIAVTLDRDGNAVFSVNGAALGAPVSIAAQSAQTLTSTTAATWGSSGATHITGTLGETFIVSGLLSASRIADIYRAGSIAPFCAYSSGIATVDGLSFFQWLDFGQGYGPRIMDRSGRGQHADMGASGLTHAIANVAVYAASQEFASRQGANYLQSDGATSNRRIETQYGTVGAVAGSDLTEVDYVFDVPTSTFASIAVLWGWAASSSSPVKDQNESLCAYFSGDDLLIRANGGSGHNRIARFAGFRTTYSGRRVRMTFAFTGNTTTAPVVYLDGVDISANFSQSTNGASPPNWVHTALGTTYHLRAQTWPAGYLRPGRPVNRKYAQADVDFVQLTGRLPYSDAIGGSAVSLITGDNSTFASDTGYWSKSGTAAISSGNLTLSANGDYIRRDLLTAGKRFRLTLVITANSAAVVIYNGGDIIATYTDTGTKVLDILASATASPASSLYIYQNGAGGATIDTVTLVPLGALSDPIIQPILVVADATQNGIGSLVVGFSPVTLKKDWVIQDKTSTSGNEQILGGSVFEAANKNRIDSWTINNAGTSRTVSLGNASAGTQFASGATAGAGLSDQALTTRICATANLWVNSNGTDVLTHTIHGTKID